MMKPSTHETSISSWTAGLKRVGHSEFASLLMSEERNKQARLTYLHSLLGLPIYPSRRYVLPAQLRSYDAYCKRVTVNDWGLALRFSRPPEHVAFHRLLGAGLADAMKAGVDCSSRASCSVVVTPYKEPPESGTFVARPGLAYLEYIHGPHFWLTKPNERKAPLLSCEVRFPRSSISYSTPDLNERARLHSRFRYCVELLMGCGLGKARGSETSVYAEFHWHIDQGPKFISARSLALAGDDKSCSVTDY